MPDPFAAEIAQVGRRRRRGWLIALIVLGSALVVFVGVWLAAVAGHEGAMNRCIGREAENPTSDIPPFVTVEWRWWPPGYDCHYHYDDESGGGRN